jgi:K+-sensing histidine kinase KdpD
MRIPHEPTDEELQRFQVIGMGEGHIGITAKTGSPLFIEQMNQAADLLLNGGPDIVQKRQLGSAMFVPLKAKGNVLGVMAVYTEKERVFTANERDLLITIGNQIGTAIENAILLEEVSRAEALEELDKLRTALLASVSHELRTPLTSIKGLASTLTQPDVEWDFETQQDFLKIIDRESDILTHIVEDLMQMSQMEAGIMTMEKTQCSITSIVYQLDDKLSDLASAHIFKIDVPTETPLVHADEIRIGEVITNLVSNAASYSEKGTQISLKAEETDRHIIVSVTDQGIGIPFEHVDKVFDRFYRLESGIARRRGGTGLGLSICKGIIESHNGKIWVKSVPGKGSTFSFSLPIADSTEVKFSEQTA